MTKYVRFLAFSFAMILSQVPLRAQVVESMLHGVVTDESGAVISGASVTVRNQDTGTERRLSTDSAGRYNASSLTVGSYAVAVEANGFSSKRYQDVQLAVGQSAELDVSLHVATAAQEISVVDTGLTVNLSNEQTSGLVSERKVKDLPLNGRSYDQLITLNPAIVNYTSQRSGSIGTSNSSVGNMFSVSGRRP